MFHVLSSFRDMWMIPDLRRRLGVTFALLAVYRMGAYLTIPGIDVNAVMAAFQRVASQPLGR